MDQDLINKNKSQLINLKSNDSTHLQLGGSLILGPKFDIKKYINEKYYEKSERKEKINLPRLFSNNQKPTKLVTNHELYTIANERLPSYKKNPLRIKKQSFDKSTTISNNNNSIIGKNSDDRSYTLHNLSLNAAKDNNAKIFETINVSKNNNYRKLFDSESNSRFNEIPKNEIIYDLNNENINLLKTIKKIKKQVDSAHKDKSIKNIMRNRIAYSPKYSDLVFKPNRIINDFNNFQERDLNTNKDDISNFISDNKDISKRNLLIKLLQKQKKDYSKDLSHRQKSIDDTRRTIEIDENNYECFTTNQKQACRRIEKNLNSLLVKNRRLKAEQQKLTAELRVREDERQKLLEQIDEYRIIAKFVSRVLESNINLFKIKIMPDYSSDQLPDYGNISDEVCERYNFLLNDEKRLINMNQENIDIINEMNDLSDSELYHQFHKMEDNIVHYLKIHDMVNKEIMTIKKERKKQSDDFEIRIKNLEEELEHYKSLYEREQIEYEDICNRNKKGNFELDEIVLDLYHDVMDIFNVKKKDEESKKNHLISVNKALLETQNLLIDKEEMLTKLISTMESYEQSNRYLFYRVVHARKNENKEMKFNLMKQIIEAGEKEKMAHMKSPENKIIFIKRKAEPPYQEPKKDKEVKIDPNLVKQLENEELMSYK